MRSRTSSPAGAHGQDTQAAFSPEIRFAPLGKHCRSFLSGGVANYLGTHWPVEDTAALAFSRALYDALTTGAALGDAVLGARRTVATARSIDWADYVHYGSPDFRLTLHKRRPQQ